MRALFATGRHADALRAFHSFRTRLGRGDRAWNRPTTSLPWSVRWHRGSPSPTSTGGPDCCVATSCTRCSARERSAGLRGNSAGDESRGGDQGDPPRAVNSAEFIQRFEAEAQLVARLEHPHIVPLYDYWREPGAAYLVFRLLLGGTALGAMVSDGPFSVARVSRLVEEVGGALLAAHTAGVVHCDVKPSNVLFDEAGNDYLSDFGIAVRVDH